MTNEPLRVVFVGAASRSGTTLLDRLLGQARGCWSLGEVYFIWERGLRQNQLCGCNRPFRDCPFWGAVVDRAFGGFDGINVAEILAWQRALSRQSRVRWGEGPERYIEVMERLYEAIAEVSGCRVLIDSSKQPSHGFLLREMSGIELLVLHVVRDPRAVVHSCRRRKRRPEIYWDEVYMPRAGVLDAMREWRQHNGRIRRLARSVSRARVVRYEDLVTRPRAMVAELLDWIQEERVVPGFFEDEHRVRLGVDHTVSGNPIRFHRGELEISPDDEWRAALPPMYKFASTVLAWPVLRRYGYPLRWR